MLPKEIKQLIELSGGKMIISEGDLTSSYVVMKLDEYLEEMNSMQYNSESKSKEKIQKSVSKDEKMIGESSLTNERLLDKINTDIAKLHSCNSEKEIMENFESEDDSENEKYHYESVR